MKTIRLRVTANTQDTKAFTEYWTNLKASISESSIGEVDFQAYDHEGHGTILYELTYRRDTPTGAFKENQASIIKASSRLAEIQEQLLMVGVKSDAHPLTLDVAKKIEQRLLSRGDDAYREYEQSLSGDVTFRLPK